MNRRAFTLTELLVVIFIMSLMILLIWQILNQTTSVVRQGTAISEIIASTRMIGDQLETDTEAMLGPLPTSDPPGVLVILNKIIPNVPMLSRKTLGVEYDSLEVEDIRSDQLLFITDATHLSSITPAAPDTFGDTYPNPNAPPARLRVSAQYVRLWYGHVRRLLPNGSDTGDLGSNSPPNSINRVGTNWILGRHALLLAGPNAGDVRATDFLVTSTIEGYGNGNQLYHGYTDVSLAVLADINAYLAAAVNDTDYKDRAYAMTFAVERLRVNPGPQQVAVVDSKQKTVNVFGPKRIAQMHGVFAVNVSHFVIDFAADIDGDSEIDIDADSNIRWYGFDDPPPDSYVPKSIFPDADMGFVWRHDTDNWPYLLRIRYRIHDANGLRETDKESGQWLEAIVAVNR